MFTSLCSYHRTADAYSSKTTNHKPWDDAAQTSAAKIARHLAYLPLALIHAGRAILHRFCSLQNYIPYFKKQVEDFRVRGPALLFQQNERLGIQNCFRSFAIIYSGLETQAYARSDDSISYLDALELVNMFAFFHNNDITLSILTRAGENLQNGPSAALGAMPEIPGASVSQRIRNAIIKIVMKLQHHALVLPRVFGTLAARTFDEVRARSAIDILVKLSLISESSATGVYSMHPLLHLWIRKRLKAAEQSLWCQTAANVVANSVKIPPAKDEDGDLDYYVSILPHVEQIAIEQQDIRDQVEQKRQEAGVLRHSLLWVR